MAIPINQVLSHWSHFFQSFALSSDSFYSELSSVIKDHNMPNSKVEKVLHKEGGLLSSEREYLRVKHANLVFDVCAAPFGKDFFISWWLYETEGYVRSMLKSTKIGNFLDQQASKRTFYQVDSEDMFRSCVHDCILETVTKVTEGKGVRELTDKEKEIKVGGA